MIYGRSRTTRAARRAPALAVLHGMKLHPSIVGRALWREIIVRTSAGWTERTLDRAAQTRERVLLGPWLGEIGYELEYWIPFMRRELRRHRIAAEQATVMTRGGAALWYRDFAAHALDV